LSIGLSTVYPQLRKSGSLILYEEKSCKRKLSTILPCLIVITSNIIIRDKEEVIVYIL